jgi:CheY-like chemotaxis protein
MREREWAVVRLLLVDDEPSVRSAVGQYLQNALGCQVMEADSGEAAACLPESYELVVTDLQMPGMGGLGLIQYLRCRRALSSIPIIAVSGASDPELKQRALDAGASVFLQKPFRFAELRAIIARLSVPPARL